MTMARKILSFILALGMALTSLWFMLTPFFFSSEIHGLWFTGSVILVGVGFGWLYEEFLKPTFVKKKLRDVRARQD
jgi:hypothetical protein